MKLTRKKGKLLQVWVEPDSYAKLKSMADKQDRGVSEVIREAIVKIINDYTD